LQVIFIVNEVAFFFSGVKTYSLNPNRAKDLSS